MTLRSSSAPTSAAARKEAGTASSRYWSKAPGSQARTSAPTFTVFVPSGTVNEVVCSRVWVPTKVVGSKSSSAGAGDGPAAPGRVISSTLGASAVLAVTLVVTSTVSPGATNAAGFEVLIEIPIGAVLTTFG